MMPSLDDALKIFETLAALHALPDKVALTTAETALFLRLSPKTVERMRLNGSGPPYIQGGGGSRGGNQKCLYLKEDLLAWQKANKVSNSMEAAIRKGRAFCTIFDLVVDAPFYIDAEGRLDLQAEEVSLRAIINRLGSDAWELIWLPVIEAAGRNWLDAGAHLRLATACREVFRTENAKLDSAIEATELSQCISYIHHKE
ncbi:helix-turn-helix domain-containing protein [Paraburkholderia ferrariae]|uniref:helix-turn-helix domain-containing protein n=1 Tax=Paraburkholderia ferrariae TaxID=386056 RepID=UPI0006949719|nr:helix-turn-helix domain-containing protein [Paraburkholderia ferrariae]